MAVQAEKDRNAAVGISNGTCSCSADDPKSGAWHQKGKRAKRYGTCFIDQKIIQYDIDQVNQAADLHWCFRITGGTQYRSEDNSHSAGQHWKIQDQKITGSHFLDRRIDLHPFRYNAA